MERLCAERHLLGTNLNTGPSVRDSRVAYCMAGILRFRKLIWSSVDALTLTLAPPATAAWNSFEFGLSAIDFVMLFVDVQQGKRAVRLHGKVKLWGRDAEVVPTKIALGFNRLG